MIDAHDEATFTLGYVTGSIRAREVREPLYAIVAEAVAHAEAAAQAAESAEQRATLEAMAERWNRAAKDTAAAHDLLVAEGAAVEITLWKLEEAA
jgi:hypothetical protein